MPEGDSVLQLSNRLQFMEGRRVTSSSLRVPRYATVRFDGLVCEEVWPYAVSYTHLTLPTNREV